MSFIWPKAFLALLAVPVLVFGYLLPAPTAGGDHQATLGTMGLPADADREAARPPASRPTVAVPARHHAPARRARPAAGDPRPPAPRGHGHPRVRRVEQHEGEGPQADPPGGREEGRAELRRQPAVDDQDRGRRLQQRRIRRPEPPTRSKPDVLAAIKRLSPKGGTSVGPGNPDVARRDRGQADRARPRRARGRRATAGCPVPGLGRRDPPHRRREHRRGSTRSRSRPSPHRPAYASIPIGLGSAKRCGDRGRRVPGRDRPRRELLRGIAERSGGTYFRAEDAASLTRIYDTHRL